jgi:hypothetical protein
LVSPTQNPLRLNDDLHLYIEEEDDDDDDEKRMT